MAKRTTLHFTDDFHKRLKILAAKQDKSMGELLQKAAEEKYFNKKGDK